MRALDFLPKYLGVSTVEAVYHHYSDKQIRTGSPLPQETAMIQDAKN